MKKTILVISLIIILGVIVYILLFYTLTPTDEDFTPPIEEVPARDQLDAHELLPTTPDSPTETESGVDPNKTPEPDPPIEERQ